MQNMKVQGKATAVTGRGDTEGCETTRLQHFLENRFTDNDEVVLCAGKQLFTPGSFLVLISVIG
jgi:hypothetical protein